ncbi:MAG: PstS family phosphate ABC transporter substrate-binding protein, partial [Nannocystaceae bacterium]
MLPLRLGLLAAVVLPAACGGGSSRSDIVAVGGSSTVYPISEAVAEEFRSVDRGRVTIGISGTGGGFKKLCKGELSLCGASRPIRPSEVELCAEGGVEYIELPVAYDGIVVVVHPDNHWVDHLSVDELRRIWEPAAQGEVLRWSDVREDWPDDELHLFGPGVDSGTYDYFTKAVVGREHASRGDFTSSEDDNVLVQGVSTDRGALGFFGLAYYLENADKLQLVAIDDGDEASGRGPVLPSPRTIIEGHYQPLSRPVFIYVSVTESARPAVAAFVDFYLEQGPALAAEVGYVPLPERAYQLV